jgi:hypothetical protein
MIGHAQIIAARKRGLKPQAIFIDAGYEPIAPRFTFDDPERAIDNGMHPTVTIPESDLGRRLDLRFVAGCRVHVHGRQLNDSMVNLADAVAQAGAQSIVVCCLDEGSEMMIYENEKWSVYAN